MDLDDGWPEDAAIMRHPNYNKEDIAFVRLTEKEEERKRREKRELRENRRNGEELETEKREKEILI